MDTQINEWLGRDYTTALRNRDATWWEAHIAPAFVRQVPGLPFTVHGPVGMRRLGRFVHGAFPEVELSITHVVAQNEGARAPADAGPIHGRLQRHTGHGQPHRCRGYKPVSRP